MGTGAVSANSWLRNKGRSRAPVMRWRSAVPTSRCRGPTWLRLRSQLRPAKPWGTSRQLFGVLVRSDLYPALGPERANAANILVWMFAESCEVKTLLERPLRRHDVSRYLAQGIPKSRARGRVGRADVARRSRTCLHGA